MKTLVCIAFPVCMRKVTQYSSTYELQIHDKVLTQGQLSHR